MTRTFLVGLAAAAMAVGATRIPILDTTATV
jgi:hypothetical protein